jgi:hypothetical protein
MYIPGWKPLSYNYWGTARNKSKNFTVQNRYLKEKFVNSTINQLSRSVQATNAFF